METSPTSVSGTLHTPVGKSGAKVNGATKEYTRMPAGESVRACVRVRAYICARVCMRAPVCMCVCVEVGLCVLSVSVWKSLKRQIASCESGT